MFTRWGRKSCPSKSKMIYRGQMAGPDVDTVGGGSNYQCLPADPDLAPSSAGTNTDRNELRSVHISINAGSNVLPQSQHLPCVMYEATQRPSQMMIPAKSRCPSGWQSEYTGYLMSSATAYARDFRMEYICVDSKPESIRSKSNPHHWYGQVLYFASTDCSSSGTDNDFDYCPPYKQKQPLLYVVCTK